MPDYSNACIYKIVCKDQAIADFYIGSTVTFNGRYRAHKCCCKNPNAKEHNYKLYKFIRSNGGWDNFDMILIRDKLGVDNRTDLHKIEGQYQRLFNPKLNKQVAGRSDEQYKLDNREKISKYHRERYARKKLAHKS